LGSFLVTDSSLPILGEEVKIGSGKGLGGSKRRFGKAFNETCENCHTVGCYRNPGEAPRQIGSKSRELCHRRSSDRSGNLDGSIWLGIGVAPCSGLEPRSLRCSVLRRRTYGPARLMLWVFTIHIVETFIDRLLLSISERCHRRNSSFDSTGNRTQFRKNLWSIFWTNETCSLRRVTRLRVWFRSMSSSRSSL
jgi:hypothetical protein